MKYWKNDKILWECYAILRKENPTKAKKFKRFLWMPVTTVENSSTNWTTIFSREDGYTKKTYFPYHLTIDEMYEMEDIYRETISSPWDCTGYRFTSAIDFYKTKDGTWMYITYNYDV